MRTTTDIKRFRNVILASAAAIAIVISIPTAAHAEGSYTSYIGQAQPTFMSRTWTDRSLDSASTKVTFSGCYANTANKGKGTTALNSVTVELWNSAGKMGSIKRATCGTFDFGRTGRSTFWFKISEINGYKGADRKIFLDVNKVQVSY